MQRSAFPLVIPVVTDGSRDEREKWLFVIAIIADASAEERWVRGIEGLRRLEIPEEMQKKHGFKPLGTADGPRSRARSSASTTPYNIRPKRAMLDLKGDGISKLREAYERSGLERFNLRYGYVVPNGAGRSLLVRVR